MTTILPITPETSLNELKQNTTQETEIPKNIESMHHNMDNILSYHINGGLDTFYINFYIIYSSIYYYFFDEPCSNCIFKDRFPIKDIKIYNSTNNIYKNTIGKYNQEITRLVSYNFNLNNALTELKNEELQQKKEELQKAKKNNINKKCITYRELDMIYEWYDNKCNSDNKTHPIYKDKCIQNFLFMNSLHKLIQLFYNFKPILISG